MIKSDNKKKGFSLIEVLTYVAALSIIIVAIAAFIFWAVHSTTKARVMRETLYNSRRSMEVMSYEIREAKSIYPTSTVSHLYLENSSGSTTEFYLCGAATTTLCMEKTGEGVVSLTSDRVEVNNLEFAQINTSTSTPSVQISLKVDYKNPASRSELVGSVVSTSSVSLRNY